MDVICFLNKLKSSNFVLFFNSEDFLKFIIFNDFKFKKKIGRNLLSKLTVHPKSNNLGIKWDLQKIKKYFFK